MPKNACSSPSSGVVPGPDPPQLPTSPLEVLLLDVLLLDVLLLELDELDEELLELDELLEGPLPPAGPAGAPPAPPSALGPSMYSLPEPSPCSNSISSAPVTKLQATRDADKSTNQPRDMASRIGLHA